MKLKLNIGERVIAIALFNEYKGGFVERAIVAEDSKQFFVTEEEWKKADRKIIDVPTPENPDAKQWTWSNNYEKDFELNQVTVDYLVSKMKEKDERKEVALGDAGLVSLYNRLTKTEEKSGK